MGVAGEAQEEKSYTHVLGALTNTPWAIKVEVLNEIYNIVLDREKGIKANKEKIEAVLGHELNNEHKRYKVVDGTAIIPIQGVISKKMNWFMEISGGVSTQLLEKDIEAALNDKKVKSIFLPIESPGGSVFGPFELSDFIYANRGKKPIIAFAEGYMASAAYLIGSAADEIITYDTSPIGSIGVVAIYTEYSAMEKTKGITKTVLTNGKYKAIGNSAEPLTKEGREYLQSEVDYYGSLFINAVSRNRGISIEDTLKMADGKVFIGKQALDIGLVDHIGNFNFALSRATKRRKAMDMATLRADHPHLVTALQEEGFKGGKVEGYAQGLADGEKKGLDAGIKKGIEGERSRIAKIQEYTLTGMEAKAEEYIKNGVSSSEALEGFLLAQKAEAKAKADAETKLKEDQLKVLKLESPETVEPTKTKVAATEKDAKENDSDLPVEEKAKKEWNADPKLRAEFPETMGGFNSYLAYLKSVEKGLVKGKYR